MTSPAFSRAGFISAAFLLAVDLSGQPVTIESAPEGMVEVGAPAFVVFSPATIGLRTAPTDIHELPDGRILLVAGRQLAFGDGTRWKVFDQAADDIPATGDRVAVDDFGTIYAGTSNGFARVDFDADETWRYSILETVDSLESRGLNAALSEVSTPGGRWFWHSGSGPIYEWMPGGEPRQAGSSGAIDEVFEFDGGFFMSDRSDGILFRMEEGMFVPVEMPGAVSPNFAVTCAAHTVEGDLIVGTQNVGIRRFDGTSLIPLVADGLLAGGRRINDLQVVEGGDFAAAVDNLGVVFFNRNGRVLQVLDRTLDNRLARARRLMKASSGAVWAVLNDGVACVEFPSHLSHMEPLVPAGLYTAFPSRYGGRLWLLADGQVHRGIYSEDDRLLRFDADSPDGEFVFTFTTAWGKPLASTAEGMFEKDGDGWTCVVPGVVNGRLLRWEEAARSWLYVGRGELGWLHVNEGKIEIERMPAPGFADVYSARDDEDGNIWLELGVGSVARISFSDGDPVMEVFGPDDGIPPVWAQVVVINGRIRFSVAERLWRFDAASKRFVVDREFHAKFPQFAAVYGRPNTDAQGRLWVSADGSTYVVDETGGGAPKVERLPGISALYFTFEENGAVWMYDVRHLVRFDPSVTVPAGGPLKAIVTELHFASDNRTVFPEGGDLGVLNFEDHSFTVSFMAPADPFGTPVNFEFMLEGAGKSWISSGINGTAVFNRLSEGSYVFRVRPRVDDMLGDEATIAFSILPPWYRTTPAYLAYVVLAISLVSGAAWAFSYLERRDNVRLEGIVEKRTNELRETNERLSHQASELRASEDRYRKLSLDLERRVDERTAELHGANERLLASNRELEAFSYSVSHDLRSPLRNIRGFADLLRQRAGKDLDGEAGRFLNIVASEASRLGELIDSLLAFSRLNRAELNWTEIDMHELVEAVRAEVESQLDGRVVEWRIRDFSTVHCDPTLLRQVIANLVDNALKFTREREVTVIEIGSRPDPQHSGAMVIYVKDNGVGFDQKYAEKVFGVFERLHRGGKYEGTGIGLANVQRIITRHGGSVWAEGFVGEGATFCFTLGMPDIDGGA